MQVHDWHDGGQHAFACRIDASPKNHLERQGLGAGCRHLLIVFNPEATATSFVLPAGTWQIALDTSGALSTVPPQRPLAVPAHCLIVLRGSDPGNDKA
jgi:glycogen operon protein